MTWIPPVFQCGECDGDIARWPMKNLLRQDILDWRHVTVPPGTGPHRAVLGTPVPIAELLTTSAESTVVESDVVPEPTTPARPALRGDLPPSAVRLDKKAAENDWEVRAWYMHGPLMTATWKFSRMVESVVMHLDRDGHRLVATWRNDTPGIAGWAAKDWPGVPFVTSLSPWKFDVGYSLGHSVDPLTSPELGAAVTVPRALCESCGEPPALHVSTRTGPVCHDIWVAALAPPTLQEET